MILVTGGAGFIGSVLVKKLNAEGRRDILLVDLLDSSLKWKNLLNLKYEQYLDAHELFLDKNRKYMERVQEIYHMGAISATTEKDMGVLMRLNVHFSQELFTWAHTKSCKIVYASSAATYGNGETGYEDDHDLIEHLKPLNPYGYSKQFFDEWALREVSMLNDPDFRWYGIKFFNVYGPNEYHKGGMRSVVHQAFEQIRDTGQVRLFKSYHSAYVNGGQLRDFIYVKDVVDAMVALMGQRTRSGIYNMGTGKARSFKDLALATFKAMKKKSKIEYIDMPEELQTQYQYFTQANMRKLSVELPEMSFYSLEDGVQDYVKKHLLQKNIYA